MEVNDPSGKPTRVMTDDQYREWVRQAVSGEIWRKFAAALSIFGLTTVFGVWTYTSNVTNTAIADKIQSQTGILADKMEKRIGDEIAYQVRHHKLIESAAKQTANELTEQNLVETAMRRLIVTQAQNILRDQKTLESSLRELALVQVLLFGDPEQKAAAVNLALQNPSKADDARAFQLALRFYLPPKDERDQSDILQNVLRRAVDSHAEFTEQSWVAFRTILGRRGHIRLASQWIRARSSELGAPDNPQLRSIIKTVAETDGFTAAEEFVEWINSGAPDLVLLGLHGLTSVKLVDGSPADQKRRHTLVRRAIAALARADREREGLSDFLSRSLLAIQQRDTGSLRRYATSNLASPRIRELLANLARNNRSTWTLAQRQLTTVDQLRDYGNYENEGLGAAAHQGLASLLDIGPKSEDWKNLVLPTIDEAKGAWTSPGAARLLVNAWVHRLQSGEVPDASVDIAARLFIDTHGKHDTSLLLSANHDSYRFLISKTSRDVLESFLDRAPRVIGLGERERDTQDIYDNNETRILSDVLTRALRDKLMTEDRLRQLRTGLQDLGRYQNSQSIWFAAAAQTAGMRDVFAGTRDAQLREANIRRVVAALAETAGSNEPAKAGGFARGDAIALLFVLTNRAFLSAPSIQGAAEAANVHRLARDPDRLKAEPQVLALAKWMASEAGEIFDWVGRLNDMPAQRIGNDPVPLTQTVTWLSFERQADRLAQVSINQPGEVNAIVVGSDDRVHEPQIIRAGASSPALIRIPDAMSGTMFMRLRLQALGQATFASLRHEAFMRAGPVRPNTPSASLPELRPGTSATIQSNGSDEVWYRLNAKAGATYIFRTLDLRPATQGQSIDTEIEVRDPEENRKLQSDDDGGEGLASLLSFRSDRNGPYHIVVKNIDSSPGTFTFEAIER